MTIVLQNAAKRLLACDCEVYGLTTTRKYSNWLLQESTFIIKTLDFSFKIERFVRNRDSWSKNATEHQSGPEGRDFDSNRWYSGRVISLTESFSVSHGSVHAMTRNIFEFSRSIGKPPWWRLSLIEFLDSVKQSYVRYQKLLLIVQNMKFSQGDWVYLIELR